MCLASNEGSNLIQPVPTAIFAQKTGSEQQQIDDEKKRTQTDSGGCGGEEMVKEKEEFEQSAEMIIEKVAETTIGVGVEDEKGGAEAEQRDVAQKELDEMDRKLEAEQGKGKGKNADERVAELEKAPELLLEAAESSSADFVESALMESESNEKFVEEEEVKVRKKADSNNAFSASNRSPQPNVAGKDGDVADESLTVTTESLNGINYYYLKKCVKIWP